MNSTHTDEARTQHVFLTRGVIAIAWAAAFAAAAHSLTTGVTLGVGVLLVLYPLIDLVASLVEARGLRGSARRPLLINAAVSAFAAVALALAATGTVANVFTVFGVWASLTGAAQLIVVLRRRAELGNQWPLLLADGVSILAGVIFIVAAASATPMLGNLAIYAASGGIDFVIQAWLLARRRHHTATAPAHS